MQMFGIGLPELMVVLFLTVVVVGPDKLPGMAADLARWIKRARAYAEHRTKDFGDVVAELEKEVGTSRGLEGNRQPRDAPHGRHPERDP